MPGRDRLERTLGTRIGPRRALMVRMPAASLAELRFFLDDRDDIAQRVQATGATTTQLMAALGAHELGVDVANDPTAVTGSRVREVCAILAEDDQEIELGVEDLIPTQ